MPRKFALPRRVAVNRKMALPRKPVGFLNDGKVHAVLDTNVVIYALEALFKKSTASQIEKDSLTIIDLIGKGILVIGINAKLFSEYIKVTERKITELRVTSQDVSRIINLLERNLVFVRMLVDPERYSPHKNDDILYNGLSTAYLISNNLNHVDPSKLFRPSSYQKTLTPSDFLADLRRQGLI